MVVVTGVVVVVVVHVVVHTRDKRKVGKRVDRQKVASPAGGLLGHWQVVVAIIALLLLVSAVPVAPAGAVQRSFPVNWTRLGDNAQDIAVGPQGEVWITTRANGIARWNGNAFEPVDGQASRIAVAPDGTVWSSAPGTLARRENNAWVQLGAPTRIADMSVSPLGTLVLVGEDGGIFYRLGDQQFQPGFNAPPARRIAATTMKIRGNDFGAAWIVGNDGKLYQNNPQTTRWDEKPGLAQDIGVNFQGDLWITGVDSRIYRWTGVAWDIADGGLAVNIAVAPGGVPWVINAAGEVFRGDNIPPLVQVQPTATPTATPFPTRTPEPRAQPQPIKASDPIPAGAPGRTWSTLALLCKFPDGNGEIRSVDQVHAMFTGDRGIDAFFREASDGQINLAGLRTAGWFQLPRAKATYTGPNPFGVYVDVIRDCANAAQTAGTVNVTAVDNLVVFVDDRINGEIGGRAIFPQTLTVGGIDKSYNITAMTSRGLTSPGLIVHEMGHTMQAQHITPGAAWDAEGTTPFGSDAGIVPPSMIRIGDYGPTFSAGNRDLMGWIPDMRKVVYNPANGQQTTTISRLNQPVPDLPVMIRVPLPNDAAYIIEYRTKVGFDATIPADAVVIHRLAPGANPRFVTVTQNPGDDASGDGAQWRPGKRFVDQANNIAITFGDMAQTTVDVTIGPAQ